MSYTEYKVKVFETGLEKWYKDGKIHRENGPAVIWADGTEVWFKNGLTHREDGPAIVYKDGRKEWWVNGQMHREDGPAVVFPNGSKYWYLDGQDYSKYDFDKEMAKRSDLCDGKFVEIDGKKYKLSLVV